MKDNFTLLFKDLGVWADAQFGTPDKRTPIPVLKHLKKEVEELLLSPNDPEEYADALLLIFDAYRRSGGTILSLLQEARKKLEICKKRQWGKPDKDGVVEHVREEIKIVHCKRDDFDIYIGRPSKWGNPFKIGKDGTRDEVIDKYEQWIKTQPNLMKALEELKGKTLGCWCAPTLRCHGEVLRKLYNENHSS